MLEKMRRETLVIGTSLVTALGITACGKNNPTPSNGSKAQYSASHPKPTPGIPNVQVKYFPNGSRELIFANIDNTNDGQGIDNNNSGLVDLYEWCDGKDLVEQALSDGSTQRLSNHPACADGRLTPSDFPPTPAESPTH